MAIKGFTKNEVSNLLLSLPKSQKEQKKIAGCLSFLDELIAAQTKKLDTIKTHKKALMQQLFPVLDEVLR
jgi:type I restriction enzyme S subunit